MYFADSELARGEFGFEAGVIEGLPTTLRRQVVAYVVRPLVDKVGRGQGGSRRGRRACKWE